MYEVTKNSKKNPELRIFLQRVVGFDSVNDEPKAEGRIHKKYPVPEEWNTNLNLSYSYHLYYMFANMIGLNQLRKERGFNTFVIMISTYLIFVSVVIKISINNQYLREMQLSMFLIPPLVILVKITLVAILTKEVLKKVVIIVFVMKM